MGPTQTNGCDWLSKEKFHSLPATFRVVFTCGARFIRPFNYTCRRYITDHFLFNKKSTMIGISRTSRVKKAPTRFQDDDGKLLLRSNANEFV